MTTERRPTSPTRTAPRSGPKGPRKRAALLAEEIEDHVLALGWPMGHLLGSESELIERYGVSRSVLREAIRLLERAQVAEMRRGRNGGLFVTKPDPTVVADAIALYLRYRGVSAHALFEVRQALEMTSVQLAASRASGAEAAHLREFVTTTPTDVRSGLAYSVAEFHDIVAELSGNPAMHLFVQVLTILTTSLVDHTPAEPVIDAVQHAHGAIAAAIAAGDPALAQRRMLRHFEGMRDAGFPVQGLFDR